MHLYKLYIFANKLNNDEFLRTGPLSGDQSSVVRHQTANCHFNNCYFIL